jgi:hypothetical protein
MLRAWICAVLSEFGFDSTTQTVSPIAAPSNTIWQRMNGQLKGVGT